MLKSAEPQYFFMSSTERNSAQFHQRTVQRISLALIGVGLLIGSVIAVFQSKPLKIEEGWTIENPIFQNQNTIVVPDQNGDGYNDLFIWINPREYILTNRANDTWLSEFMSWNKTTGSALFDGKTGQQLKIIEYENTNLFISNHQKFTMVCTPLEKVIILAAPVKNYSFQGNPNQFLYIKSYQLVTISLNNLSIEKTANITGQGWEPLEMFDDPLMINYVYNPGVNYLRNPSIAVPYSSYTGDVIALKTTFKFWNGSIYNQSKTVVHFINPETLQKISEVELDTSKVAMDFPYYMLDLGFCEYPSKDTEYQWNAPFFYVLFANSSGVNKENIYLSMTPISNLKNYFDTMTWIILKTKYITLSNTSTLNEVPFEHRIILNLNQTGVPVSVTVANIVRMSANSSFSEEQRQQYDNFFPWLAGKTMSIIQSYIITTINFENPMNLTKTFQDVGAASNGTLFTFDLPVKPFGTLFNIVPLKASNDTKETTIGLLFMKSEFEIKDINKFKYPFRKIRIDILKEEAVGTKINESSPGYSINNGSKISLSEIDCVVNPSAKTKIPFDFDINKDGVGDIPLAGTFNDNILGSLDVKVVNGPYFTIMSDGSILQTHFYQLDKFVTSVFLSDVNGDGISDAFLSDRIMIFGKSFTASENTNFIKSRLENAATRGWIFAGGALFVVAILILIISLAKRQRSKIIPLNARFMVISLIVSIGLIWSMFYLQNMIVEASKAGIGTLIGSSSSTLSIQAMINASNLANFVFLSALPITLGIYVLSASSGAKSIVALNQLIYKNNDRYRIVLSPPFGRNPSIRELVSRVSSILFLATSIGLYSYNYLAPLFFDVASFETIESISDPIFAEYMNAIFEFLVIPGIISIPLFAWLFPSSWLLDDTGCLYYLKKGNARRPEDVESIGRWFGNTIKGFFGISAIINYIQFSLQSPIVKIASALGEYGLMVMIYAFGFIIVAGIAFGLLTVAIHEIILVNNAVKFIDELQRKDIEIKQTLIDFSETDTLSPEKIVEGYENISKKISF